MSIEKERKKKKRLPASVLIQSILGFFSRCNFIFYEQWDYANPTAVFVESILLKSILIANNARGSRVLVRRVSRGPIVIPQQYVSTGSSDDPGSAVALASPLTFYFSSYTLLLTSSLLPLPRLVNFPLRFPQVY